MKISVTLINSIIIMAISSIILIAVVPYLGFNLLQKHVVDEAIISFNNHGVVLDSIFTDEYLNDPKTIEGFNYEELIDLGDQIGIDLSSTIRKSKDLCGSYWLLDAYSEILWKLIQDLAYEVITAYSNHRIIASIMSLLGLLFVYVLGKILLKKLSSSRDDDISPPIIQNSCIIYRVILSVVILASSCYSIFYLIKNLITFIKYPPVSLFMLINASPSFYFEGIVILTGIIVMILIFITLIDKKDDQSKNYLAFFWTVPVLAISLNLFLDNSQKSVLNTIMDSHNLAASRMVSIDNCSNITYSARQWYMQNEEKYTLEDFLLQNNIQTQKLEHGTYDISVDDTLLTITGTGNYVSKEGISSKVTATYNSVTDSLDVEILQ